MTQQSDRCPNSGLGVITLCSRG